MAKPRGLNVSPDLTLPLDAVTTTIAIVAMVGAGKSNAGAVLAEEMHDAGLPWIAIDPKGDWWGLRSNAAGDGPGLQVPIFGGLHGDLPLHEEMGRMIADLIVDTNLTCILDISEFPSKASQMRFLTAFGDQLFRRHGKHPQPRHLIMEEADEYLPQVVRAEQAKCVDVWTRIAKRGRQRGLGFTIITQRCASVNKDPLSQCATLIPLRTQGAHDRKAILEWISYHDSPREIVDSLPGLADGESYAISPNWLVRHGQPPVQQFRWRQRRTFDSGATPLVGEQRRVATLADIDLGALAERMAAVVEKAAAEDPAVLRKRIADLERKLRTAAPDSTTEVASLRRQLAEAQARPPERIEVPVLAPGDVAALEQAITGLRDIAGSLEIALSRAVRPAAAPAARPVPTPRSAPLERRPDAPTLVAPAEGGDVRIGKRERAILTVLAQYPDGRTHRQIALLTGYSPQTSTIGAGLSVLRSAGYVSPGSKPVLVTADGIAALGSDFEPLPSGPALLDYWNGQLGKRERDLLAVLLDRYPGAVRNKEMAEATGYSAITSTIGAGMSKLRGLGLAEGWSAAPDFVEAIRADETLASAMEAVR